MHKMTFCHLIAQDGDLCPLELEVPELSHSPVGQLIECWLHIRYYEKQRETKTVDRTV